MLDLSVILSLVGGGALVTALGGLVGVMLQSRREHRAWLRERRYDAYVRALTVFYVMRWQRRAMDKVNSDIAEARGQRTDEPSLVDFAPIDARMHALWARSQQPAENDEEQRARVREAEDVSTVLRDLLAEARGGASRLGSDQLDRASEQLDRFEAEGMPSRDDIVGAMIPLRALGTDRIEHAAQAVQDAATIADDTAWLNAERALVTEIRRALGAQR